MTKGDAVILQAKIKADLYRALWIQGIGIVAVFGTIVAIATALS